MVRPPVEGAARHAAREEDPVAGINAGHVVFRVRGTMGVRLGRMVTIPLLLAGGLAAGPFQAGVSPLDVVPPVLALGLLAVWVGRKIPDVRCSEPRCGTRLGPDDGVCPRCGGRVAGEIGHVQERLEAEERLEAMARQVGASVPAPGQRGGRGR